MKKTFANTSPAIPAALLSMLLAALVLLSGCGASSASYDSAKEESYYDGGSYSEYDNYGSDGIADYSTAMLSEAAASPASADPAQPSGAGGEKTGDTSDNNGLERKMIRNADIEIETENAAECYRSVLEYAVSLGGYESSSRMSKDEYSSSRYIRITATLKLPPDKLDEFVEHAGAYGDVTSSSVTSEEITENYYDLKTRLTSKQKALESYYDLLDKAESIEEILSIQNRIDSLTEEIESVKGKLRVYDALVAESTVDLEITEKYNMPLEEKDYTWDSLTFSSFLKLIKNGFLGVCNFLWSLLQWLLIIIISASPIIVLAAAIILIARRLKKKGIIKQRKKKAAAGYNTPVYSADSPQANAAPAAVENTVTGINADDQE